MKIELRKITYTARLSEETSAYAAQLWVDDSHICDVSNHGTGGADVQHPAKGKSWADVLALDARIKAELPKRRIECPGAEAFECDPDIEGVCADLLAEHLISRDLQRTLKRTIAYFDPDRRAIFTLKGKIEGVDRAHAAVALRRRLPAAVVLNDLPFSEALSLYRAHAQ